MRILFITNVTDFYITREPLGLAYLSGAARQAGHETRFCGIREAEYLPVLYEFGPEVIAYSIATGQHRLFFDLNLHLKSKFKFLAVFGGPHATFWPQVVEEPGVDAVCRGEGEEAFLDFLSRYENGTDYENTPNWWVKRDGKIYKNDVRHLTGDLDTLPWPDRESIFATFKDAANTPVKCFVPNRGCPYNCAYCFNEPYYELYKGKGKRVRIRTPEAICDEIQWIREISMLRMPMFTADIFAFSNRWLEHFKDVYKERIDLPYYCNVRANLVDDKMAQLLAESGCACTSMGIEAGNERIRNEIFCRGQNRDEIINAAKSLKKHGVTVVSFNILGVPGTGLETDIETLDLNREARVDYAGTFTLVPLPGTKIHKWVVDQGLMDPLSIDDHFNYYGKSPLKIEDAAQRGRLYYLFALALAFDPVYRILPWLLNTPLDPLYRFAHRLFRGWRYKRKAFPVKHGFFWTLRAAWRYLFYEYR